MNANKCLHVLCPLWYNYFSLTVTEESEQEGYSHGKAVYQNSRCE